MYPQTLIILPLFKSAHFQTLSLTISKIKRTLNPITPVILIMILSIGCIFKFLVISTIPSTINSKINSSKFFPPFEIY